MTANASEPVFAVRHHAWSRLPPVILGQGVTLRRVRGGVSEVWCLDLDPGSGFATSGITAEGVLTVVSGRLRCVVFGNEVELPAGNFAVLPPNTPFVVRVGGRAPAQALAHFNHNLPDAVPLEIR